MLKNGVMAELLYWTSVDSQVNMIKVASKLQDDMLTANNISTCDRRGKTTGFKSNDSSVSGAVNLNAATSNTPEFPCKTSHSASAAITV